MPISLFERLDRVLVLPGETLREQTGAALVHHSWWGAIENEHAQLALINAAKHLRGDSVFMRSDIGEYDFSDVLP